MRRFDKLKNIYKANLLNEVRYLESKGLMRENDVNDYLYHGTNIKNLKDIENYGLVPDFGNIVKSTEGYQYYMDDEYYNPEDRVDGVLFFSDKPDTWSYSHFGGTPNIDEAVLIIIEKNDTIFRKIGEYIYDMDGNKVNSIKYNRFNYLDIDKIPPFIEDGDYFSFDEQEPIDVLYGDKLKEYLNKK
jgi:hypothetical protein